jgi:D-ribose pyranose/furanose isomerase RbsD
MLEMELTLTLHILIYMLDILTLTQMVIQATMEQVIKAMAMKATHIDMHTANLQQDLEVIHYWNNHSKKQLISHKMLKKMDIKLKIL